MLHSHLVEEDRHTLRTFARLGTLAFIAMATAFYWKTVWGTPFPRDATTLVVGRDFLNFWMYARAALHAAPGCFYDPNIYNRALQSLLGANYPQQTWSYPPNILLVMAPFGFLGYRAALLVWTLLSAGGLYALSTKTLRARSLALSIFVSPAAIFCLFSGQSSFFILGLLIAVFGCLDRRPVLAGILIGLLTLKPQVGLLLPVMLIAGRRWRTLAAAILCACALVASTAAIYGLQVWVDYLRFGVPAQNEVLGSTHIIATQLMPTVFMNLHLAGLSYNASMVVQSAFTLAAGVTVYWAFHYHDEESDRARLVALFFACSASATPYLMPYDALPLAYAVLLLMSQQQFDQQARGLARLVWWMPFVQMALGLAHIPATGLFAPVFAAWLTIRLWHRAKTVPASEQFA